MKNLKIEEAWNYHNLTKHSYESVRSSTHFLDWDNQPLPYKEYLDVRSIPLSRDFPLLKMPALEAISTVFTDYSGESGLSVKDLSNILFHSAGIIRRKSFPGGISIDFRAAACAGALYPIEIYVVCGELKGLEAGVYHFSPRDFALKELRRGDWRGVLVDATGGEEAVKRAPIVLVYTAVTWRSSWKYQSRAYRYHFWDTGTIVANTLAVSTAYRLPAKVIMGFVDDKVNRLIGVDGKKEKSICLVSIGSTAREPLLLDVPPLDVKTLPFSAKEIEYPPIQRMHCFSSLKSKEEVIGWKKGIYPGSFSNEPSDSKENLIRLSGVPDSRLPQDTVQEVILRRTSTRRFSQKPVALEVLSTILYRSTRGILSDFLEPLGVSLNDIYLIVNAVEGLPSGAFFFHRERNCLELLKSGLFRRESGYLTLEQRLGRDAAVVVFFLSDLSCVLERLGNRGYRAVQLESGILGGKLYLGAHAFNIGATGLTFYDDDITEFFSPHAKGKSAIFVVALGVPGD
jgi:SagB-type dehydrogenase family enzyme